MSKRMIWALVLIALLVIVLVLNDGTVKVELLFTSIHVLKSLVFLGFTACGVVIGLLLR